MNFSKKSFLPFLIAGLSLSSFADDFNKAQHKGSVGLRHGMNGVTVQGQEDGSEQRVINEGEFSAGYEYISKNMELLRKSDVAIYFNIKTGARLLIPIL